MLQQRLRLRLQAEMEKLRAQQLQSPPSLADDDLLALVLGTKTLKRFQHHRERIDGLQAEAAQLANRARELNQTIHHRLQRRDELLLQYAA